MRELAERTYFHCCLALGWLLRFGRYSQAKIISQDGEFQVRKRRLFYAPCLVWLGGPLFRILGTGVRVLSQLGWEERERLVYQNLHDSSVRVEADGTLVLPYLAGEALATLLDNPGLEESSRQRAIALAVASLAEFHHLGLTHGDAMAENVLIDLDSGVAHWFDFETLHDVRRPIAWHRADDVRALLMTCLARTAPEKFASTLHLILDRYADEGVSRVLAASFTSIWRRSLPFHLGQARLSWRRYRAIVRLLGARSEEALK
jgi:hypothetical protein